MSYLCSAVWTDGANTQAYQTTMTCCSRADAWMQTLSMLAMWKQSLQLGSSYELTSMSVV